VLAHVPAALFHRSDLGILQLRAPNAESVSRMAGCAGDLVDRLVCA
jgi:hypothetical protein